MKLVLLWVEIFWAFAKVSLLTWGGGPASLALMKDESVQRGFITEEEFADAIALGNSLPGPIAPEMAIYIGYKRVQGEYGTAAGIMGGIMGMLGSVVPTSLLMLAIAALFFQVKDRPEIQSMLKAVRPIVVAMLLWTAYDIGRVVFIPKGQAVGPALLASWDRLLLMVIAFVALAAFRVSPAVVVVVAAVVGLVLYR